jgi:hypothetical protein
MLLLVAACGSRAPSPRRAIEPAITPEPGHVPLVAARENGLYEIGPDGRDVRRLSATPAQHPRWQVPGRRILFLTRDTSEVRSLDLVTAKEQVVARIRPKIGCPRSIVGSTAGDSTVDLGIQEHADFTVDGDRACLELMDRNSNMASYLVNVRIDLATGATTDTVSIAPAECKLARREAPPRCVGHPAPIVDLDRTLEHAGPAGFTVQSWSPSGRWVVLRGNDEEGDSMHFQIVLYELATRNTFPILGEHLEHGDAWPQPLRAVQLAKDAEDLAPLVGDVVGETPIHWLPGPDDRLVVDEYLVVPGVRIAHAGQLAY